MTCDCCGHLDRPAVAGDDWGRACEECYVYCLQPYDTDDDDYPATEARLRAEWQSIWKGTRTNG